MIVRLNRTFEPHYAHMQSRDARISVIYRERNGHISEASNSALSLATGEWIALLDHDDLLHPMRCISSPRRLRRIRDASVIYSDEDKIDRVQRAIQPIFQVRLQL